MRREDFEKCKKIDNDIREAKKFLDFYRMNSCENNSGLLNIFCRKEIVKTTFKLYGDTKTNSTWPHDYYNIPEELQKRIVKTIEEYVEDKEKELEEI